MCHERFGESVEEQIFMQQLDCILDTSLGVPHSLKESSDSLHRGAKALVHATSSALQVPSRT